MFTFAPSGSGSSAGSAGSNPSGSVYGVDSLSDLPLDNGSSLLQDSYGLLGHSQRTADLGSSSHLHSHPHSSFTGSGGSSASGLNSLLGGLSINPHSHSQQSQASSALGQNSNSSSNSLMFNSSVSGSGSIGSLPHGALAFPSGSGPNSSNLLPSHQLPICKNFEFGRCSKGDSCRFAHPSGGSLASIIANAGNSNSNQGNAPFSGFLPFGNGGNMGGNNKFPQQNGGNKLNSKNVCWDWIAGRCERGGACKYVHQNNPAGLQMSHQDRANSAASLSSSGAVQSGAGSNSLLFSDSVCHQFQKSGRCQYGDTCKFAHLAGPQTGVSVNLVGNSLNISSLSALTQSQASGSAFNPASAPTFNPSSSGVLNTTINASPNSLSGYTFNIQNIPATINGQEVCRFYAKTGRCKYGNACKFVHINGPGLGAANLIHHQHHNQQSSNGTLGVAANQQSSTNGNGNFSSSASSSSSNPFAGLNLPPGVSPALIAQLIGNLANGTINANTLALLANALQNQQQGQGQGPQSSGSGSNGSSSGSPSQSASTAASPSHSNSRSDSFFRTSSVNHSTLHSSVQSHFQEDDQDLDDILNLKVEEDALPPLTAYLQAASTTANPTPNSVASSSTASSTTGSNRTVSPFYPLTNGADSFNGTFSGAFSTGFGRPAVRSNNGSPARSLAETLDEVASTIASNSTVACVKCSNLPSVYQRGFLTLCWRCCPCVHCGENEGRAVCAMGVCEECYENIAGERLR